MGYLNTATFLSVGILDRGKDQGPFGMNQMFCNDFSIFPAKDIEEGLYNRSYVRNTHILKMYQYLHQQQTIIEPLLV